MFKPEWLVFLNLHYSKRTETANYTVVDFFRTNLEANNEEKKPHTRFHFFVYRIVYIFTIADQKSNEITQLKSLL